MFDQSEVISYLSFSLSSSSCFSLLLSAACDFSCSTNLNQKKKLSYNIQNCESLHYKAVVMQNCKIQFNCSAVNERNPFEALDSNKNNFHVVQYLLQKSK